MQHAQMEYDSTNRLLKYNGKTVKYDADGKVLYYYYGANHLLAQEQYVNEQARTSVESAIKAVTGSYLLYHFNNVGSTTPITDQNGKVKYQYQYSSYGETRSSHVHLN